MFAVDKLAYTLKIDLDHINVCIYVHVDLVAFLPLLPIIVIKVFYEISAESCIGYIPQLHLRWNIFSVF